MHANLNATSYIERTLSTKMNNDKADGHCYGFAWILRSCTFHDPYLSFQKQILFTTISTLSKNEQDFFPRDIESCHLAAARRAKLWSLNANLFFYTQRQLQIIRLDELSAMIVLTIRTIAIARLDGRSVWLPVFIHRLIIRRDQTFFAQARLRHMISLYQ